MQRFLRALAALALACCARAASHSSEDLAQRWLADHRQAPGANELNELKSVNPEAYAIVQALMMKQSMGLIKRKSNGGELSKPLPAFSAPMPEPLNPPALPAPAVVAEGPPTDLIGSGPPPPEELPEIAPQTPTAPPPMPPPPPISPALPPALDEPVMQESSPAPGPAPVPDAPEPSYARLSAAATSSTVSTASVGGHSGLNWNPEQMMADNERMVSNVLGAVAQLTGAHVHRAAKDHQDGADSPLAQDEVLSDAAPQQASPLRRALGNVGSTAYEATEPAMSRNEAVPETLPMRRNVAVPAPRKAADSTNAYLASKFGYQSPVEESVQTKETHLSPADEYLASQGPLPMERARPEEPSDDGIAGHLPDSVSWSNPYTFTASANVDVAPPRQENSYLREVDLGIPLPRLKRSSDDQNPYLQGLDLTGSSSHSAPTDISASSLTAMHQNQLLSSHTILYEHDLEWIHDSKKQQLLTKMVKAAPKKDALSGFLAPSQSAEPKAPPASLVNKNVYLAKLGESNAATAATAVSDSGSSTLASNIEQDNPYLMTLDDAPILQRTPQVEQAVTQAPQAMHLDMDVSHPQLSMTSSNAKVHEKSSSKTVTQKAKMKVNLSGWLGGEPSVKKPDAIAERLHRAVAQRVADNKNPYLQGLDIDAQKGQAAQDEDNPYMASFD